MSLISGISDFFGLDIGTGALRAVQLRGGSNKSLVRYGQLPIEGALAQSDSKDDQAKLAEQIKNLIIQMGLTTRNVVVGLPTHRVFTTVVDVAKLEGNDMTKSIRYQADSFIPTPLAESKIDFAVIGESPKDNTKSEVLLSSVANDFVEMRLDMLESIGLNPIAFEPDSMALARSIIPADAVAPYMILDIGTKSADLVIAMNKAPRLTRAIATGSDAIIRSAVQNLGIDEKQAEQFIFKFGLSEDKLEGQIRNAIIGTIDILMAEIEKSIQFFNQRYTNSKIERIIVTGGASSLPEFPLYIANKFGISVEIGNAWRNISFPANKQNELLSLSNHFGVAAGLAMRVE